MGFGPPERRNGRGCDERRTVGAPHHVTLGPVANPAWLRPVKLSPSKGWFAAAQTSSRPDQTSSTSQRQWRSMCGACRSSSRIPPLLRVGRRERLRPSTVRTGPTRRSKAQCTCDRVPSAIERRESVVCGKRGDRRAGWSRGRSPRREVESVSDRKPSQRRSGTLGPGGVRTLRRQHEPQIGVLVSRVAVVRRHRHHDNVPQRLTGRGARSVNPVASRPSRRTTASGSPTVGTVASTPDSKDAARPLVSHTTARPRQDDTSFVSQTNVGRHRESDPAEPHNATRTPAAPTTEQSGMGVSGFDKRGWVSWVAVSPAEALDASGRAPSA